MRMCTINQLKDDLRTLGIHDHVNEATLLHLAATSRLDASGDIASREPSTHELVIAVTQSVAELQAQADRVKKGRTSAIDEDAGKAQRVIEYHRKLQYDRLRPGLKVITPFAESIEFPITHPSHACLLANFITIIEAIAFLDQGSRSLRSINGVDYIEATADDFHEARRLFSRVFPEALASPLPDDASRLLAELKARSGLFCTSRPFSVYDVESALKETPQPDGTVKPVRLSFTVSKIRQLMHSLESSGLGVCRSKAIDARENIR